MRKASRFLPRLPAFRRSGRAPVTLLGCTLLSTAGAALPGCSYDLEHDYSVTATWLLNGSTPDQERCDELGIASMRLTMNGPGPAKEVDAECSEIIRIGDVSYGGFETGTAFDFGVSYAYTLDALDAKGKTLYAYEAEKTAYYGDFVPVDLDTVDIFEPAGESASFSAQWVFTDGDLAADCERNQIDKVAIRIASATDPVLYDFATLAEADCAAGIIESKGKVLARGDYYFQYVALDARGAVAEKSEPIREAIDGPGDLALARHQFQGL